MPVAFTEIRSLLLPGLWSIATRYEGIPTMWDKQFHVAPEAPHIWIPNLITLPEAALIGAAAAIIKNPEVTRRFWSGWLR